LPVLPKYFSSFIFHLLSFQIQSITKLIVKQKIPAVKF